MLDISNNRLPADAQPAELKTVQRLHLSPWHLSFRRLMLVLLGIGIVFLLLPWTQNIQADGRLTTLRPEQRPQTIHATIAGRIEQWYVTEGQLVHRGDTIIFLSEVKSDYFDPALVERVGNQVVAKEGAITSYGGKMTALEGQIAAMRRELDNKTGQITNKIEQQKLKIISDSIAVIQARNDRQIAQRQFEGIKVLYDRGIEPLVKFEERRLKVVEAETKLTKADNDLSMTRRELQNTQLELTLTRNEFANKIAKSESDRFSAMSDQFDAQATVSKLKIERDNYARRASFYFITAPQDGYIVKAVAPGIGEIIKEGEPVVTIMPSNAQLAVEMFVKPIDIPLLSIGRQVRFMFDGWPAFFFSGWPGLSLGTYAGDIVAIDRNISENGKFRVLVSPAPNDAEWPEALRVGGGAKGIALLNDVPLWYELWRMFNGFPPDMYKMEAKADAGAKK
jgi:membrane fusion protein, adhesin transport system